jgi:hypothetical protein
MNFLLSRQAEIALEGLWDYYFQRSGTRDIQTHMKKDRE